MKIQIVSTSHGYSECDITGAGSITRVKVLDRIKYGDIFNIYYGRSSKEGGTWKGKKTTKETFHADLKKSIRAANVFIAESIDSEVFYKKTACAFCDCECINPSILDTNDKKVLAVDLEWPEYGRDSSRYIVFLSECGKCGEDLTYGSGFGSFNSSGLPELKKLAEDSTGLVIDWPKTMTSISELNS